MEFNRCRSGNGVRDWGGSKGRGERAAILISQEQAGHVALLGTFPTTSPSQGEAF